MYEVKEISQNLSQTPVLSPSTLISFHNPVKHAEKQGIHRDIGDEPHNLIKVQEPSRVSVIEFTAVPFNTKQQTSIQQMKESLNHWCNLLALLKTVKNYFYKWRGLNETRPKRLPWHDYLWTWLGAFLGIIVVATLHYYVLEKEALIFITGSFGATATVLFGAPKSSLAQPRNLIGGHLVSAIIGCIVRVMLVKYVPFVACALAVACAIVCMQLTETFHPPGGAVALIAVQIQPLPMAGFLYILIPVLSGSLVMLLIALIVNNLPATRSYPTFWW
ncbi:unnamed protein product [Didymodactylos carnosus]|uniref:HPP transmembrane region domain-containing protein n=1 Tax=Didymodactylos carnosus TaxID=1234261 RepID=A0A813Y6D9_9BILA|nr:unnamed protein product [Didymodactylos carnosus]CAF3663934.1 unnamed protein product [Didymodactylos carnosus]